jgi:GNAT superfamily N-acetyltransferase
MACGSPEVVVRVAGADDAGAIAALRSAWTRAEEPGFAARMAEWIAAEGERRTTWVADLDDEPVGMASLLEYRRMPRPGRPPSAWGYVSNMFVYEHLRDRGIGSALLEAVVAAAEERRYARLVLSPSERALPFYRRAGFVVPDEAAGGDRLLVRAFPSCRPHTVAPSL